MKPSIAYSGQAIHAIAPLRLSFAGGGTDFPHYFEQHGGAVLAASIDMCAHAMDIRSDAPARSGLGGSSALVTSVVAALAELSGRHLSRHQLAELSYGIERIDLGIPGGMQDQYAAAFGGLNVIEFSSGGVQVIPVHVEPGVLAALRDRLLLCYTGRVRSDLGLIDEQIRMYHEGREETILGMKGLHEAVYLMRDALLAGDLAQFGRLLHEAYESKKLMNPHIVRGAPIDQIYERARAFGATGGKLCGAGGGGYLVLYCEPRHQPGVVAELERLGAQFSRFHFRQAGLEVKRERPSAPPAG